MRPLVWSVRLVELAALCSCLLAAAAALGRGIPATQIIARGRNAAPSQVDTLLIDLDRGVSLNRHIEVPDVVSINWLARPPQVIQRTPVDDVNMFIVSSIDPVTGGLKTLIEQRSSHAALRELDIALTPTRAAIYEADTGKVTLLRSGQPALTVDVEAGISPQLVWSPNERWLAVKAFRAPRLVLVGSDGTARSFEVFRDSQPVWSPDSRYILFTQDSFVERNGRLRVYDAMSGEILPEVNDLPGQSGTWCGSEMLGFVRLNDAGKYVVHTLDVRTGAMSDIIDDERIDEQEIVALRFAPRAACDWLLLTARYPNDSNTRMYRLSAATGVPTRLGMNVKILSLTADDVVYDSNEMNVALTVARAPFSEGASPEVYGRSSAQIEGVTWFDDYQRGVFLRSSQLWYIDLTTGESRPLPITTPILTFQVVAE